MSRITRNLTPRGQSLLPLEEQVDAAYQVVRDRDAEIRELKARIDELRRALGSRRGEGS